MTTTSETHNIRAAGANTTGETAAQMWLILPPNDGHMPAEDARWIMKFATMIAPVGAKLVPKVGPITDAQVVELLEAGHAVTIGRWRDPQCDFTAYDLKAMTYLHGERRAFAAFAG